MTEMLHDFLASSGIVLFLALVALLLIWLINRKPRPFLPYRWQCGHCFSGGGSADRDRRDLAVDGHRRIKPNHWISVWTEGQP